MTAKKPKPWVWWCLKTPYHPPRPWECAGQRRDVVNNAEAAYSHIAPNWRALRRLGFRAIKVTLVETSAEVYP